MRRGRKARTGGGREVKPGGAAAREAHAQCTTRSLQADACFSCRRPFFAASDCRNPAPAPRSGPHAHSILPGGPLVTPQLRCRREARQHAGVGASGRRRRPAARGAAFQLPGCCWRRLDAGPRLAAKLSARPFAYCQLAEPPPTLPCRPQFMTCCGPMACWARKRPQSCGGPPTAPPSRRRATQRGCSTRRPPRWRCWCVLRGQWVRSPGSTALTASPSTLAWPLGRRCHQPRSASPVRPTSRQS
jgi:hypothetical protein